MVDQPHAEMQRYAQEQVDLGAQYYEQGLLIRHVKRGRKYLKVFPINTPSRM